MEGSKQSSRAIVEGGEREEDTLRLSESYSLCNTFLQDLFSASVRQRERYIYTAIVYQQPVSLTKIVVQKDSKVEEMIW